VYTFVGQLSISCAKIIRLTFVVTLSLLFVIFGTLVVRSVRLRRQRNAVLLAGCIPPGTHLPATAQRGKRDSPLAPKPLLWEAHLVPLNVSEKGWGGIIVRLLLIPHLGVICLLSAPSFSL
jgi:hypothetical protein